MTDKLKTLDEVIAVAAQARSSGKIVVFTNGCFDLLHRGHVHILREAKAAGDLLIVAINNDRSVKAIKGPARPVCSETDRVELIAAMEMVDYVILFDEPDPYELIAAIKPNVLAKGGVGQHHVGIGLSALHVHVSRVLAVRRAHAEGRTPGRA